MFLSTKKRASVVNIEIDMWKMSGTSEDMCKEEKRYKKDLTKVK